MSQIYSEEFYKEEMERIAEKMYRLNAIDAVKIAVRNGNVPTLNFLLTMDPVSADNWITGALIFSETNEMLELITAPLTVISKCVIVKAYRKILQKKRKAGLTPTVYLEDLTIELKNTYKLPWLKEV